MKIILWTAEPGAPTSHAYLARFLGKDGFLPAFCTAATEDAVREKAAAFLETETARLQKGGKPRGKPDPVEKAPVVDKDVRQAALGSGKRLRDSTLGIIKTAIDDADIVPPPIDETPTIPESDLDDLLA